MAIMIKLCLSSQLENFDYIKTLSGLKGLELDNQFGLIKLKDNLYVIRTTTIDNIEERRRLSNEIVEVYGDIHIEVSNKEELKTDRTSRGFAYTEFEDRNGRICSIQDSSIAFKPHIWLGVSKEPSEGLGTRMHLSQEEVRKLLPLLQRFVDTGTIEKT